MTPHYLVLHGPNLNLLGTREPHIYGTTTLADITTAMQERAHSLGCTLSFFQSNHEGAIIDYLQEHGPTCQGILINAGGFTHTSVAIRDCLAALAAPTIEVHLSNLHRREEFRQHSYLSAVARAVVMGFGWRSYLAALEGLHGIVSDSLS